MNTRIDHAHMGINTCIQSDQSENMCVPDQQATMRYQERRLVHNNNREICHRV